MEGAIGLYHLRAARVFKGIGNSIFFEYLLIIQRVSKGYVTY